MEKVRDTMRHIDENKILQSNETKNQKYQIFLTGL